METILILSDYKNKFGSKWDSSPYRSGFDKDLTTEIFKERGIQARFANFCDLPSLEQLKNSTVLYTSSEDLGGAYKSFIEDVVLNLERAGVRLIPPFDLLRAHNNKVYMELFRKRIGHHWGDTLNSHVFGTLEELEAKMGEIDFPVVIKKPDGAMSRGVFLARNQSELNKLAKSIARVCFPKEELKDRLRPLKHSGYKRDSVYRKKFIIQAFIPNLENDWKILVFGERIFVLTRHVRENDFRASGSHCNYQAGSKSKLPEGILDYVMKVRDGLDVPHLSLDVVYDGQKFHTVEFQALYFGTSTVNMSDVYFMKDVGEWEQFSKKDLSVEQLYVDALVWYLNQKQ